jgi:hypothetical protein
VLERDFERPLPEARAGGTDPVGAGWKPGAQVLRRKPKTGMRHAAECSGRSRYDPAVANPAEPGEPGERPGGRRLGRPPGDRYVEPAVPSPATTVTTPTPTHARGLAWASAVAIAGAAAIALLAGALNVTLGLLVVAAVIGRFVAVALLAGGGPSPTAPAEATSIAIASVTLGQLGIWLFARSEGGVLAPLDYLGQTFGWLVPLQLGIAAIAAWWSARSGTGG